MVSVPQRIPTPAALDDVEEGAEVVARRAGQRDPATGHGAGDDERAGFDAVGDDAVLRATQTTLAVDLDGVRVGALDLRAHLLQEHDQVVDLGFLRGGADHGMAVGKRGREHRVLGAHDRHEREADLAAPQSTRRRREVVAVSILDLRAERPHRVDVEVHRPAADPVAARVADDHPAEPRE